MSTATKTMQILLYFCTIIVVHHSSAVAKIHGRRREVINLLALVPWPDDRPHADWDAGPDLLAGARVAINEINNSTDVLPNHRLNMIESGHEACGLSGANTGLVNMVKKCLHNGPVAVILGLFCSTSTKILSPIAGKKGFDTIQLSGSNSPDFLASGDPPGHYPHLYRFLESATVHADTVISMMDAFQWKKVALVADFENSFLSGISDGFIKRIKDRDDLQLMYRGNLLQLANTEDSVRGILESRARIIFLSTTAPQTAKVYCIAARLNMHWPNYVWIMADYLVQVIEDEVKEKKYCSLAELRKVTEGSLITYFSLEPDDPSSTVLVSNDTYQGYKDKYDEELELVKLDYPNVTIPGEYLYAGIIYDQVWAFAKATHSALPELHSKNYSITEYGFGQPHITTILEKHLKQVDFIGATGRVSFNDNNEVSNSIKIFQVWNSDNVQVGTFDARNAKPLNISIPNPPDDDITVVTSVLPTPVAVTIIVLSALTFIIVTVNLVITLLLRSHNEIRALSPYLSILIFFGCYLECLASVLLVIQSWINEISTNLFTISCNVVNWIGLLGIYLILATNLLKIARIFRLFSHFGKTGRCWKSYMLALWSLFICLLPCCIIPVWVLVDPLKHEVIKQYRTDIIPVYLQQVPYCRCKYYIFWTGILQAYVGILIFGLIFFSVQTRKINRRGFKDTKKVNGFVFFVTFVVVILLVTQQVLRELGRHLYANISLCLLFLSMSLACQVFLFLPKVIPATYERIRGGKTASRKYSTTSGYSDRPPSPHTFTKTITRSRIFSQASMMFPNLP